MTDSRPADCAVPKLTIVVVFHNMQREAARTLEALSVRKQVGVSPSDYEVIAVDSNSSKPLAPEWVCAIQENYRYTSVSVDNPAPCHAVNVGVNLATATFVSVMVDGARIPSPGVVRGFLDVLSCDPNAFVMTLGMHLGPKSQNLSISDGYCQEVEDTLLAESNWESDPYKLFLISSLARSSAGGYFSALAESNCFALAKTNFAALGGFDERFVSRGGGLVNLDFFRQAVLSPSLNPVMLLGEATFHQFHGGVATNVPLAELPMRDFRSEYRQIRGEEYSVPHYDVTYFGRLPKDIYAATTRLEE